MIHRPVVCRVITNMRPGWEDAEIHIHCGVIRRNKIKHLILVTPHNTEYKIPEALWDTPVAFDKMLEHPGGWAALVQQIRSVISG